MTGQNKVKNSLKPPLMNKIQNSLQQSMMKSRQSLIKPSTHALSIDTSFISPINAATQVKFGYQSPAKKTQVQFMGTYGDHSLKQRTEQLLSEVMGKNVKEKICFEKQIQEMRQTFKRSGGAPLRPIRNIPNKYNDQLQKFMIKDQQMQEQDDMTLLENRIKLEIERDFGDIKFKSVIDIHNILAKMNINTARLRKWGRVRGFAKSIGRMLKGIKDIRKIRMSYKNDLLIILQKQIYIYSEVLKIWIINHCNNFLSTIQDTNSTNLNYAKRDLDYGEALYRFSMAAIRAKNILKIIFESSHSHSLPSPIIQFLIFLSKSGAFIPYNFLNELESNHLLQSDINGALADSDPKTKIVIIGFFFFEKVLIRKVLLKEDVRSKFYKVSKNMGLISAIIYYAFVNLIEKMYKSSTAIQKIAQKFKSFNDYKIEIERVFYSNNMKIPQYGSIQDLFISEHNQKIVQQIQKIMKVILQRIMQLISLLQNRQKALLKRRFEDLLLKQ
eukprot:403372795